MHITMVKKIFADGHPCGKCEQAEDILKKRGIWNRINRVVTAMEANPDSEGMKLADKYKVELAPFFIADTGTEKHLYTRVLELINKELKTPPITFDPATAAQRYADLEPQEILAEAQAEFAEGLAISFSGAEDIVLIDMAIKNKMPFRVFCLDTGRLHEETYTFIDEVREHYAIPLDVYTPKPQLLEPFIRENGLNSFYSDGHKECCSIRKVEPLQRALASHKAWAVGLRRDQNPATRSTLVAVEPDKHHCTADGSPLIKFSPLLEWSSRQVWNYIRENNVPYNRLHDLGFISIGCAPCTRPARPGEHERMSRWWWEEAALRECGLHKP